MRSSKATHHCLASSSSSFLFSSAGKRGVNRRFLSFQDDVFSPQGQQQSYTLDPHRKVRAHTPADPKCFVCQMLKNRSAEAALCFCDAVTTRKVACVHRCVFSYKGAFDERSDGPFCSPSDEPGAHGSTPFQRAAHRLPDAQSLPSAPGAAAHAARRTAARGEGNMSLI